MQRGLKTPEAIRHFLDLDSYRPTTGLELHDMDKALERIQTALQKQEHILIYGDFDVDGITGTAILYETLTFLGANVSYYIPDRAKEGHGLNTAACIRLASSRKVKLVITTDTGITNFAEVSLMNGLGIDTIVTDHHELPENLPPAIANVNPKRFEDQTHPLAPLCGAGVAFKLCELLLEANSDEDNTEAGESVRIGLLDLVAVGTVADLASLLRENRYLVYEGLKVLNTRHRLGLRTILEHAGNAPENTLTSESIAFTIAPRLNAIGRLDNATQAVELLTTDDATKAGEIAAFLEQLNRKRRELCDETFLEADRALTAQGGLGERRAIVLGKPHWNLGVIGIVASRLIEKYHVPVFMMLLDEEAKIARCSARSIPGFHLHDRLLACTDLFDGFGGHAGAGGFKLPMHNLNLFKERIYQIAETHISDEQMLPLIEVDDVLDWSQLNPHLVTLINKMAPFGMDNPSPKFMVDNARIVNQRGIGENEKHLKLSIGDKNNKSQPSIEALYWNYGSQPKLDPTAIYRFVVTPENNTFNGNTKVQLIIEDIKKAGEDGSSGRVTVERPNHARAGTEHGVESHTGTNPLKEAEPIASGISSFPESKPLAEILSNGSSPESAHARSQTVAVLEKTASENHRPSPLSTQAVETIPDIFLDSPPQKAMSQRATQWIDHRGREAVEAFVGQLMLPLQESRSLLVYHEGQKPAIPFLDETLLINRHQGAAAEELVFWDFPPDRQTLQRLLEKTRPRVIHWVGGKFQTVPVFQPEKNYLSLLLKALKLETAGAQGQMSAIQPKQLASRLSLSLPVVQFGILLLNRLGLIQAVAFSSSQMSDTSGTSDTLDIMMTQAPPAMPALESLPEFTFFRQATGQMSAFRNQLMSERIETLKHEYLIIHK